MLQWKDWFSSVPKNLYWFIIVGFLARILLAIYTSEPDVEAFASSSVSMLYGNGPYSFIIVYPPGWILLLNDVGRVAAFFLQDYAFLRTNSALSDISLKVNFASPWIVAPTYAIVEKCGVFVFDCLSGMIIVVVALRRNLEH